ncbi:hypothetical protein LCGC14_2567810 [marine sediment metagenome]|uniref:Uncharacterized protein n=1 Tax=marine sediment metagenome TaxID=412755 RepID=A0A0F9AIN9_9ZZZZ
MIFEMIIRTSITTASFIVLAVVIWQIYTLGGTSQ